MNETTTQVSNQPGKSADGPLISVIIPCYNIEPYLAECLDSVIGQNFDDFEVVCIDDGSTDGTPALLGEYAASDARVRVFHQANKGLAASRNRALALARGRFIIFVDGDDYLDPNALSNVYAAFAEGDALAKPVDIVVFGGVSFPAGHWAEDAMGTRDVLRPNTPDDNAFEILFTERGCLPFATNKAYRMSFLQKIGAQFNTKVKIGEDNVFNCLVFPEARYIRFIDKKLYHYRAGREGSLMTDAGRDTLSFLDEQIEILATVLGGWSDRNFPEEKIARLLETQLLLFGDEAQLNSRERVLFCARLRESLEKYPLERFIELMKADWSKDRYRFFMRNARFADLIMPDLATGKASLDDLAQRLSDEAAFENGTLLPNPEVSVVVPVHGSADRLRQCLDSIAAQTLENIEVICEDSGSAGPSGEIVDEFVARDVRFRRLGKTNLSYGDSINQGMAAAHGRYIGVVEHDDWTDPGMFEVLATAGQRHNGPDIVMGSYWRVCNPDSPEQEILPSPCQGNVPFVDDPFTIDQDALLITGDPDVWKAIYRADFLESEHISFAATPDSSWAEDRFMIETMVSAKSIVYLDKPLYFHREFKGDSSSIVKDPRSVSGRWIERDDVLKRRNVTAETVIEAHYSRGCWSVKILDENFPEDDVAKREAQRIVERIDYNTVIAAKAIPQGYKDAYQKHFNVMQRLGYKLVRMLRR